MATMSMNKVIHGAFRRDLDRFVSALDAFQPGDEQRAAQLGLAWDNFDAQLRDHHEGEHEIAWPHLERAGVSRDLLVEMDGEHEVMAAALAQADTAMQDLRRDASAGSATVAAQAMRGLRTATVDHLDHEERELEPFYLDNVDHPEVVAMGRAFAKGGGPAKGGRFFAWVLDGAGPEEQEAARSTIPAPVLAVLSGVFGRSYRKTVAPVWRGGASR